MSRIRYIFLLIVLLIPTSASSKYGIMTFDGKIITPAIYDRVDNRGIVFGEETLYYFNDNLLVFYIDNED